MRMILLSDSGVRLGSKVLRSGEIALGAVTVLRRALGAGLGFLDDVAVSERKSWKDGGLVDEGDVAGLVGCRF